MKDGQNDHILVHDPELCAVRESWRQSPTNPRSNFRIPSRRLRQSPHDNPDTVEEPVTQTGTLRLIPGCCALHVEPRREADPDAPGHSRRSMSPMTSSAGRPRSPSLANSSSRHWISARCASGTGTLDGSLTMEPQISPMSSRRSGTPRPSIPSRFRVEDMGSTLHLRHSRARPPGRGLACCERQRSRCASISAGNRRIPATPARRSQ